MVQELSVDVNEGRAPREARHVELRRVLEAADVECRGEGLDTVELAGLAVVDRVGGHKPGQEPGVTGLHLVEGRVAQPGPGAVYHGGPGLHHDVAVPGGDNSLTWTQYIDVRCNDKCLKCLTTFRREADPWPPLTQFKLSYHSQSRQLPAAASLGITL